MVLRRCRHLLGDEDSAQDALQDVFAKVLEKRLPPVEFPSSWLYTVATRVCLDRLRSAPVRREAGEDLLLEIAASEDLEGKITARRILDRIFRRHEASTKVIAVLHYLDGLTLAEVAEQVGLSVSGVRKRLEGLKSKAETWAAHSRRGEGLPAFQGKEPS